MPEHSPLHSTKLWFERGRPEPTPKDIHSQLGCHFEEVAEMIDEISALDGQADTLLIAAYSAVHNLAEFLKDNAKNALEVIEVRKENRVAFIDAIADQLVTATGSAHVLGMDPVGALAEVNRSNWSKYDDDGQPIYDPVTHKITKGPNYRPADLTPYV
jgi:predicted HAD superfamily Cof-like phosphohydrolase